MTTLTDSMLNDGEFVVIRLDLVRALGGDIETAVVLQRIAWRCEHEGSWRATQEQIREETGLSEWKVKRSLKRLRDLGWLVSERTSTWDPTPVFRVISVKEESSITSGRIPPERAGEILPDVQEVLSVTVMEESSITVEEESSITSSQIRKDSDGEWDYEGGWLSLNWKPLRPAMDHARTTYPGVDYYAVTVSYIEYLLRSGRQPSNGHWMDRVKQQYERDHQQEADYSERFDETIRRAAAEAQRVRDERDRLLEGTTTT